MPILRRAIFLSLSLAVAIGTGLYAKSWMEAERARAQAQAGQPIALAQQPKDHVMVLVAAHTLAVGTFVQEGDVRWQAWPEDGIAEGYSVKGSEDALDPMGAVVRQPVNGGQPLTQENVVRPGERGFLAAVLKPGKRAVSVPVNATTGISGFVFPGDRVDVLFSLRTRGKDEEGNGESRFLSSTLLEGVRVLAVDQVVDKSDGEATVAKTATLEVQPKEAEKIALALEMGALSLSLNSLAADHFAIEIPMETASGDNPGSLTLDSELFDPAARFGRSARGGPSVTVIRGATAKQASF